MDPSRDPKQQPVQSSSSRFGSSTRRQFNFGTAFAVLGYTVACKFLAGCGDPPRDPPAKPALPPMNPETREKFDEALSFLEGAIKFSDHIDNPSVGRKDQISREARAFFGIYKGLEGTVEMLEIPEGFRSKLESLEKGDMNINFRHLLEDVQRYQIAQLEPQERQSKYEESLDNIVNLVSIIVKNGVSDSDIATRKNLISDDSRKLLIHQDMDAPSAVMPEFSENLRTSLESLSLGNFAKMNLRGVKRDVQSYKIEQLAIEERQKGLQDYIKYLEIAIEEVFTNGNMTDRNRRLITEASSLSLIYHDSLEDTERSDFSESLRTSLESLADDNYADVSLRQLRREILVYQAKRLPLDIRERRCIDSLKDVEMGLAVGLIQENLDKTRQEEISEEIEYFLVFFDSLEGTEAARPELQEDLRGRLESLVEGDYTGIDLGLLRRDLQIYLALDEGLNSAQFDQEKRLAIFERYTETLIDFFIEEEDDVTKKFKLTQASTWLLEFYKSLDSKDQVTELSKELQSGLESLSKAAYSEVDFDLMSQELRRYRIKDDIRIISELSDAEVIEDLESLDPEDLDSNKKMLEALDDPKVKEFDGLNLEGIGIPKTQIQRLKKLIEKVEEKRKPAIQVRHLIRPKKGQVA